MEHVTSQIASNCAVAIQSEAGVGDVIKEAELQLSIRWALTIPVILGRSCCIVKKILAAI